MSDISDKFVVVTVTEHEARVWATGISKGSKPEMIYAPSGLNNHHFRDDPKIKGRGDGPYVQGAREESERKILKAVYSANVEVYSHGINQDLER